MSLPFSATGTLVLGGGTTESGVGFRMYDAASLGVVGGLSDFFDFFATGETRDALDFVVDAASDLVVVFYPPDMQYTVV